jgi:hypothetical protein
VRSIAVAGNGDVIQLTYSGDTFEHTPGATGLDPQVGGGVRSIAVAGNGDVIQLTYSGNTYEHTPGATGLDPQIGGGVASIAVAGNGDVIQLTTTGDNFEHRPGGPAGHDPQIGSGDSYLVSDATGNVFVLSSTDGGVYEHDEGSGWSWAQVGSGDSSLASDAAGNVFALNASTGDVYEHVLGSGWSWALSNANVGVMGTAHPLAGAAYSPVNGSLFGPNGPSYLDVQQGGVGDCWLMASLAEVAARAPQDIRGMFTYDGSTVEDGSVVGVYTVGFYNNSGLARYVVVDTELPAAGGLYHHPVNGVLWVALAEKAYPEANAAGFVTTGQVGADSYDALNNGWPSWALPAVTGLPASEYSLNPSDVAGAWNQGKLVVLCTSTPASSYIVRDHCSALVGYDPSSGLPFQLFNAWGADPSDWAPGCTGTIYGLFNANAPFLSHNFTTESFGAAAAPGAKGAAMPPRPTEAQAEHPTHPDATAPGTAGTAAERSTAGLASQPVPHRRTSALDAIFADSRTR